VKVVDIWTGRHVNALRQALRLTNEGMAAMLGTSVRTVAKWNAEPDLVPVTELQRALDTALDRATEDAHTRFSLLMTPASNAVHRGNSDAKIVEESTTSPFAASAELRLAHDPVVADALDWLDDATGWNAGETESRVRGYLQTFDIQRLRTRARRRTRIPRQRIANALTDFYGLDQTSDFVAYQARVSDRVAKTSLLTRSDWLDIGLVLGHGDDHLAVRSAATSAVTKLTEVAGDTAASRMADTLATDTRLVNKPLYRLDHIDLAPGRLTGSVSMTNFTSYALTMDLLERETLDALIESRQTVPGTLPLRDLYLPTTDAVTDLPSRLCAGGPLALFAAARPGSRFGRDKPDYVLLVQQRSSRVLNAAGRLAVIPKAFHEPLVDFSDDAQLSATLERELEEELFGRNDVDSTQPERIHADPFHISRLSQPMRWLVDHNRPDHWRMECTGFGLNLVSGNFEFACLIVIEDETWWAQFGGQVEANWETDGLRRYSSLDADGLAELVHDDSWSNEGLFALLQGLRRLREVGSNRIVLPPIDLEM
jgi:hypothetical protein